MGLKNNEGHKDKNITHDGMSYFVTETALLELPGFVLYLDLWLLNKRPISSSWRDILWHIWRCITLLMRGQQRLRWKSSAPLVPWMWRNTAPTFLPVQPVFQQLNVLGCVLFQSALCTKRKAHREQEAVTFMSFATFISRDASILATNHSFNAIRTDSTLTNLNLLEKVVITVGSVHCGVELREQCSVQRPSWFCLMTKTCVTKDHCLCPMRGHINGDSLRTKGDSVMSLVLFRCLVFCRAECWRASWCCLNCPSTSCDRCQRNASADQLLSTSGDKDEFKLSILNHETCMKHGDVQPPASAATAATAATAAATCQEQFFQHKRMFYLSI